MNFGTVEHLLADIEARDQCTAAHTWRVILYTRALAEAAGLDDNMIERLSYGAAVHDVGKLDVPAEITAKPGPLTPAEFDVMKTHAPLGHARLLAMGETDPVVLALVRHHHERWDGKGYPDGLAGVDIPLPSRFFSVIDSFDAMTSVRPYRAEVGPDAAERAIAELNDTAGTRYAPEAVTLFTALYHRGGLRWILDYYNDTCPVPQYSQLGSVREIKG